MANINWNMLGTGIPTKWGGETDKFNLNPDAFAKGLDDLGDVFGRWRREDIINNMGVLNDNELITDKNDPALKAAKDYYIQTGDLSQVNNYISRLDRLKQEQDQLQLQRDQLAASARDAASDRANNLAALERAAKNAIGEYNDANEVFSKDSTPERDLALRGLKRKMDDAIDEYVRAGGDASKFYPVEEPAPEPEKASAPGKWTVDQNGLGQFNVVMQDARNKAKGKGKFYWGDQDYDDAYDYAVALASSNDPSLRSEGVKLMNEINGMRKYRESDRKASEAKSSAVKEKAQAALDKAFPNKTAVIGPWAQLKNSAKDGKATWVNPEDGKTYTVNVVTGKVL